MTTENGLTNIYLNVIMVGMIKTVLDACVELIYPAVCVSCRKPYPQKENSPLCEDCYDSIKRHSPPFCLRCGRSIRRLQEMENLVCRQCKETPCHFDRAWSLCLYDGLIKNLIHDFKYKQKIHYSGIFKKLLKEFIACYRPFTNIEIIIPVPLHAVKLREREYNQSLILACALGDILKKPVCGDCLERIRNTKPQFSLHEKERSRNVAGCFRMKNAHAVKEKSVLIVDDIMTTGTTLSEAARLTREAGCATIEVLTIAS